jgi:hypothetical protein
MSISLEILFESLINEGRTKSVIDKWSNYVVPGYENLGPMKNDTEWSDVISLVQRPENDPSKNGKYIDWVLARLVDWWSNQIKDAGEDGDLPSMIGELEYLLELVDSFHKFSERNLIKDKDIYDPKYKDLKVMGDVLAEAGRRANEIAKERELKSGVDKIYEDSRWLVVVPKTYAASCHYGAGTKWCTTSKQTDNYFKTYTTNGVLYYILDKTRKQGSLYKFAIHKQFGAPFAKTEFVHGVGNVTYMNYRPTGGWGTGYNEEDNTINLDHIMPVLPERLQVMVDHWYQVSLDRRNEQSKDEAIKKATDERRAVEERQNRIKNRIEELNNALITEMKRDDLVFLWMEGLLDGARVHNRKFIDVYGNWEYMSMDNGHRFQIYHAGDYPNTRVEAQSNYFVDGQLLFENDLMATIRLYKSLNDEPFGVVEHAEAINVNLPISLRTLLFNHDLSLYGYNSFFKETLSKLKMKRFDTILETPQDEWNATELVQQCLRNDEFYEKLTSLIQDIIDKTLYEYFFHSNVPSKDGSVLWQATNSHSSYKFEYPAHPSSLTTEFLNYVRENPGRTAEEFYEDVVGHRRPKGHNSMFFGSIKDAGLVRMERNGRQFVYYIGPNYEAWTQGRLKRI